MQGHLVDEPGICLDDRRAVASRHALYDAAGFALDISDDGRDAGLEDAGLLEGDTRQRIAEMRLVIERNGGDGGDFWRQDIGGVETASETDLDNANLHPLAPKCLEGDRRCHLEERRRRCERPVRPQPIDGVQGVDGNVAEQTFANRFAVDGDALLDACQVRRRIQASAVPRVPDRTFDHRADRTFAIGPGDVNRGEAFLGVSERLEKAADVVEPELDAEVFEREQALNGALRRHRAAPRPSGPEPQAAASRRRP
jgi:hypothetical protein